MSIEYRKIGTRFVHLHDCDTGKHKPYDYRKEGLLIRVMSPTIVNTVNRTTQLVLKFVETTFIELMEYVDELRHFKNWNFHRY